MKRNGVRKRYYLNPRHNMDKNAIKWINKNTTNPYDLMNFLSHYISMGWPPELVEKAARDIEPVNGWFNPGPIRQASTYGPTFHTLSSRGEGRYVELWGGMNYHEQQGGTVAMEATQLHRLRSSGGVD